MGRQVGVLARRDGAIQTVIVGDATSLEIPEIGRLRGRLGRLRGLRLLHTHLRGESLSDDDLNDLALLRLDLVAMIEVTDDGLAAKIELAHVLPYVQETGGAADEAFRRIVAPDAGRLDLDFLPTVKALEAEFAKLSAARTSETGNERVLVIGVTPDDEHFEETLELVRSAGVQIAGWVRQKRQRIHPRTVVGPGKLSEIVLDGMRKQADVAVFDVDLKPAQSRAFEDETGLKAVDRTQLILDIFAQRAKSRDGKLQVELAQLKYSLPRLTEKDAGLSRLSGGIGGRGPGETVLEIGRRRINDRIRYLEKEIGRLARQRDLRRQRRRRNKLPVISIIGYTNAGKTTLLNALTKSSVEVEDKMFVTLDPTTRRLRFPREGEVVLSDTVGFLRDLPEELLAAFSATLEELESADLLLHVLDASDPHIDLKAKAVERITAQLELHHFPRLVVLNKTDLLSRDEVRALARRYDAVTVSAVTREGLAELILKAEEILSISLSGGFRQGVRAVSEQGG